MGADHGGWRVNPEISGGGHFVDLGSHILDLLDWLLGPVTHVAGTATNRGGRYRAEDLVTGVFSFRSGVEGVGIWNYDSFQHQDQVEIIGTAGALRFSCFADEPLRLLTARGVEQIKAPYPETVQLPLIQAVVNALTGHGGRPATDTVQSELLALSTLCYRTIGIVTESRTLRQARSSRPLNRAGLASDGNRPMKGISSSAPLRGVQHRGAIS
jgi:predicted dehydrogenase